MKTAPYGYRFQDGRLVEDEAEQAVIRFVKQLRAAGLDEQQVKRLLWTWLQPKPKGREAIETIAREAEVVAVILQHRSQRKVADHLDDDLLLDDEM